MKLKRIPFSPQEILGIPEEVLSFFVQICHFSDELMCLQKMIHFAISRSDHEVLRRAENDQALLLVKVLAGKLFEAREMLQTTFFAYPQFAMFRSKLPESTDFALKEICRYFDGSNNSIKRVRNGFAFHYSRDEIKAQLLRIASLDGEPLDIYLAEEKGNTLFHFSEIITNMAMVDKTGSDYQAGIDQLFDDVLRVSRLFSQFAVGCTLVILDEHCQSSLERSNAVDLPEPPTLSDVRTPFFVRRDTQATVD